MKKEHESGRLSEIIVTLDNIEKSYSLLNKTVQVLKRISLNIRRGEFLAVIGPSGSGKTTLLNLIGGLDSPTKGKIFVNGKDLAMLNPDERINVRKHIIGFVFQSFNLIPTLSAYENIEIALLISETDQATRKKRIYYLLQLVDLEHRADHRPDELSEGEIQRVAFARALANNPSIILADEPTANLDHETAKQIILKIQEINEKTNQTFLIATHDYSILEKVDRILILENGMIREKLDKSIQI